MSDSEKFRKALAEMEDSSDAPITIAEFYEPWMEEQTIRVRTGLDEDSVVLEQKFQTFVPKLKRVTVLTELPPRDRDRVLG